MLFIANVQKETSKFSPSLSSLPWKKQGRERAKTPSLPFPLSRREGRRGGSAEGMRERKTLQEGGTMKKLARNPTRKNLPAAAEVARVRNAATNERGSRIGDTHHNAALTDGEVGLVRDLRKQGFSFGWLARKFEVGKSTVVDICSFRTRAQTPAVTPPKAKR